MDLMPPTARSLVFARETYTPYYVNATGMVLYVHGPTHMKGHTLDVLMTRSTDEYLVRNVTITDMGLCDHFAVNFNISVALV